MRTKVTKTGKFWQISVPLIAVRKQNVSKLLTSYIERFSFECRKVIGFAFTTLRDWLKRFAPLFHPIRSKTKTNCVIASRALLRVLIGSLYCLCSL